MTKLRLISFKLCPYVHRCATTLKRKGAQYDIEYINLSNKPDWFLKLSPLGKVPILVVNDKDVLFESAVINEMLDEMFPPASLDIDIIKKAKERAWIEFSSAMLADLNNIVSTTGWSSAAEALLKKLALLEDIIGNNGYFKGSELSLIDTAYAPLFFRMSFLEKIWHLPAFRALTKVAKWAENLANNQYVKDAVVPDFRDIYLEYVRNKGGDILS